MDNKKIVIIGAGLAGLSTAYFLEQQGLEVSVFEKEPDCGGLCRSIKTNGFTFDFSGHLLHFRNKDIFGLVKSLLPGNLIKHKRNAWVQAFNRLIPSPFQANLFGLPKNIARDCLTSFIEANTNGKRFSPSSNLADWISENFGQGISRHFMLPYNRKFWQMPLEDLSHEWTKRFVVLPSFKEIVEGSLGRRRRNLGYNSFFWYPEKGGIAELIKSFSSRLENIHTNQELIEINLNHKTLRFKNRQEEKFDVLIYTIPLPELANIVKGLPKTVLSACKKLNWLSIYNLNFGLESKLPDRKHWVYFPQEKISFFRVGFFSNFSYALTPRNQSSLYAEVSYHKNQRLDKGRIASKIKADLKKYGLIDSSNSICCQQLNDINYAYPIYDNNYQLARETILEFLEKNSILTCGRYGSWQYLSMEDVILAGKNTADSLKNSY